MSIRGLGGDRIRLLRMVRRGLLLALRELTRDEAVTAINRLASLTTRVAVATANTSGEPLATLADLG